MSGLKKYSAGFIATVVLLAVFISGCQTQLMPTPNLYVGQAEAFENVPEPFRSNTVDILYVTDRKPITNKDGTIAYGPERSNSVGVGSCIVQIGKDISWDELVADSVVKKRKKSLPLSINKITEILRFYPTPYLLVEKDGQLEINPEIISYQEKTNNQFHQELQRRLAITPHKEAYIFIHGFNNTFEYSAFVMAGIWHFLERRGVPIIYTWPAGQHEGMLRAYTHDTESAEFTIFHLKEFLRSLAACPQLEKVHIISHSRGTAVASSALRELVIANRAAGLDSQKELKIGNVIMAAPDIDIQVAMQRLSSEQVFDGLERNTIYVSDHDKAIGISGWLYSSALRVGRLGTREMKEAPPFFKTYMSSLQKTQIVNAQVKAGFIGHSYFHTNPSVSSDLILILRDNEPPGKQHNRPLKELHPYYWVLKDGYPFLGQANP